MSPRRVELSQNGQELKISFPYDERLLPVVRALPRRRFDRGERAWFCPVDAVREVVDGLQPHQFVVAQDVLERYAKEGGMASVPAPAAPSEKDLGRLFDSESPVKEEAAPPPAAAPEHLSVSELNRQVRAALLRAFPQELWLVGEVTGFERNRHRRHVYFELVEKETEEAGGQARATVSVVLFERTRQQIEERLRRASPPIELQDGVEIRVKVRVDLYEPRGSFQCIIENIDPLHTLGRIVQNREKVLAELERRGLREQNLSLPWPELPLRVGLITSHGSDAYNDFLNELQRSAFSFSITVVHAAMQGQALQREVPRALRWFRRRAAEFDVLAIVRGGGARTDLLWFDSLEVALAVARHPLKIISGIGHHRDVSVLDLITHREKTPTAAADALVQRVRSAEERVLEATTRLRECALAALHDGRHSLLDQTRRLSSEARRRIQLERERLDSRRLALPAALHRFLVQARRWTGEKSDRLRIQVRARGQLQRGTLDQFQRRLRSGLLQVLVERRTRQLGAFERLARSLHPRAVLRRGYALVRDAQGRLVRDSQSLEPGDNLHVTLDRGRLDGKVTQVHRAPPAASGAAEERAS